MNRHYDVVLSYSALMTLSEIRSRSSREAIKRQLKTLETFPRIGAHYDPPYDAEILDVSYRVIYVGNFGIYYNVQDELYRVDVDYIVDQRRNPKSRFQDSR